MNEIVPLRKTAWRGQTDSTLFDNGDRRWKSLLNCYVHREGSEIRRFPGWRPAALPNFAAQFIDAATNQFEIASWPDSSGPLTVTLAVPHRIPNGTQLYIAVWGTKWIEDAADGHTPIPFANGGGHAQGQNGFDGFYLATFGNDSVLSRADFAITLNTSTNGSNAPAGIPAGHIAIFNYTGPSPGVESPYYSFFYAWANLKIPHAMVSVRDRLMVIGEIDYRRTRFINDTEVLSAYTITVGGPPYLTTLTISVAGNIPYPNYKPVQNEYVLLENVTGPGATQLNNKRLRVQSSSGTFTPGTPTTMTFTVETATPVPGAASGLTASAAMVRKGTADSYSLAAYTLLNKPDIQAPSTILARGAIVANTIRDWGGRFGSLLSEGYRGTVKRKPKQIPRRLAVDVAGNRALLAAPGYGVCFQVPVVVPVTDAGSAGVPAYPNTGYDRPRALGIPKGAIHKVVPTLVNADQRLWTPDGVYKLRVAYRDDFTGETGLASDEVTCTVAASATGNRVFIRLQVLHPGYLMSECMASSVLIYCSRGGGDTVAFVRSVKLPEFGTEPPFKLAPASHVTALFVINLYNFDPSLSAARDEIDFTQTWPSIPQMGLGSKCLRTIRATTFGGGSYGDLGQRNELQSGQITAQYDTINATTSKHQIANQISMGLFDVLAEPIDRPFNMASAGLPPAYAGTQMFSATAFYTDPPVPNWTGTPSNPSFGNTLPPGPLRETFFIPLGFRPLNHGPVTLAAGTDYPEDWWPRWEIEGYRFNREYTYAAVHKEAYIILPRGQEWYSELGEPGTVAGINRILDDTDREEDIEAIGRFQNVKISCSRSQTLAMTWGDNPGRVRPSTISSRYGCIAPNSMCEFDKGLAWISDRGPVLYNGGVYWIGADVQEGFIGLRPKYQRDLAGMMLHSFACYDPERAVIYFGLRTGRLAYTLQDQGTPGTTEFASVTWDTASENQKTKFPCDEILVYSCMTGAWSTFQPRFSIHWMERVLCADGVQRVLFLADDGRIYALEDTAQDINFEPVQAVASTSTTAVASATFTAAAPFANLTTGGGQFQNGTRVEAGMTYAIYDATTKEMKATGLIATTPSASSATVALDLAQKWAINDVISIGLLSMECETNKMNFGNEKGPKVMKATSARFSLYSRLATTTADGDVLSGFTAEAPPLSWARVTHDSERAEAINTTNGSYQALIEHETEESLAGKPFTQEWNRGGLRGHEISTKLRVTGGQQLRLANLTLEIDHEQ